MSQCIQKSSDDCVVGVFEFNKVLVLFTCDCTFGPKRSAE